MALADTLALATFFDLLKIDANGVKFGLDFMQQRSVSASGKRYVKNRGYPLLSAELTTVPVTNAEAEGIMALINSRAGGLKSFLLTNPRLPYPSSDPTGTIFGSAAPVISAITDRLHVAFTGFPNDYVIPLGTWFGVLYDTSHYYIGQFCEARTANGSGAVASVEVYPPLPDSIAVSDPVTVKKPPAKFTPLAETAYISQEDGTRARVSFSAEQDLG